MGRRVVSLPTQELKELLAARGACAGTAAEEFHAVELESQALAVRMKAEQQAKAWCYGCPVREGCLELTLRAEGDDGWVPYGVWGGLTVAERMPLVRERRVQRRKGAA